MERGKATSRGLQRLWAIPGLAGGRLTEDCAQGGHGGPALTHRRPWSCLTAPFPLLSTGLPPPRTGGTRSPEELAPTVSQERLCARRTVWDSLPPLHRCSETRSDVPKATLDQL